MKTCYPIILIRQSVKQGHVLSSDLFSLYSENLISSIENMPGIAISGHIINNLCLMTLS